MTSHALRLEPQVGRDFLVVVLVGLFAIPLGLLINALRSQPLPIIALAPDVVLARSVGGVSDGTMPQPGTVTLEDVMTASEAGDAVVVDARESAFYELGHIPGAVNLPRAGFRESYPAFREGRALDQRVIVYCAESACEDSTVVARALQRLGFTQVVVFPGGWEEWEAASMPTEAGNGQ